MEIQVRYSESTAIVEAPHRITATHGARSLRRRVTELMDDGRRRVVLDLQRAKYADSFGLAELAASFKEARNRGVAVAFHCPKGRIRDLLNVTRLDDVLPIHEKEYDAVAAVQGAGAVPEGSTVTDPRIETP